MKKNILYFSGLVFMALPSFAFSKISTSIIFNHPECKLYTYKTSPPTYKHVMLERNNKELVNSKTKDIYCRTSDFSEAKIRASPAFQEVENLFRNSETVSVDGAFFIFDSNEMSKSICSAYAEKPFKLNLILQKQEYSTATKMIQSCMGNDLHLKSIGCDWLSQNKKCKSEGGLNTMHVKILRFSMKNGGLHFIYGSGNINHSLYSTRDVWLHSYSEKNDDSALAAYLTCQINVLSNPIISGSPKPYAIAKLYYDCTKKIPRKSLSENDVYLTPMKWLPGNGRRDPILSEELPKLFSSATSIFITTQDIGGENIKMFIEDFLSKNGTLKLLLDDDWFYVRFLGENYGMADYEVAESWLRKLILKYPKKIEVRYLETDNTANFQTSLHHKFILFYGPKDDAVFFGSPNIKDAAFLKNIESIYVSRSREITTRFKEESEYLWSHARTENEMPYIDSNDFK
ncbi:phospholipase D family protein [Pectobacterium sp. PL64]|uniref:phospholipase D-like domain-containing protein n=1 Tax=Pectobacterium sp. PL64 TaxID=2738983 RepID=UPI001F0C8DF5|nr:phospholipase D-like domain-containing protein [Pectobacterium sp. PL64]UMO86327.1 phospholipase D family protein [Pectobacterium sp. PL64]